jgi:voltage-gated potassium channel
MHLRKRVYQIIEPDDLGRRSSQVFDRFIIVLIFLNVLAIILESVESLHWEFESWFNTFEWVSVLVFSMEYLLRLWTCVEKHPEASPEPDSVSFSPSMV